VLADCHQPALADARDHALDGRAELFWLLVATLWMPWIDYGKTYRGVSASLAKARCRKAQLHCQCVNALKPFSLPGLLRQHPHGRCRIGDRQAL
jgi:hypothetical protein